MTQYMKKSKRKIEYIVIHCTATAEGKDFKSKDIDRWHRNQGWSEIGYNYVITLDGKLELGRDVDKIPSQVKGYNSSSIGVVYVGGVALDGKTPKDTRTTEQKNSILKLLKELKTLYPSAKILGHRDFPKVAKACPSFDAKNEYKDIN